MVLYQSVPIPASGQEAWPWVAALIAAALGYVFIKYTGSSDSRIKRCEDREDKILEDNRASTATLKELSSATLRSIDVAEDAFDTGRAIYDALVAAIIRNDASIQEQGEANRKIIEKLDRFDTSQRRKSPSGVRDG